jgi:O-antigen/teichoic acid export membrane protein
MKFVLGSLLNDAEPCESASPLTPVVAASVREDAAEEMVRPGLYSVFDQGIVSGVNFFTTLMLARSCSQEELGAYSLAWTVVLFLAAVQGNLITVPYTMYCHRRSDASLAEYAGSTLAHQLFTSLAAIICFLGLDLLLSFGIGPERVRPAAWVLLGVIPFLLLREYARRFTLAHLAMRTAVAIDASVAVVQIATLIALARLGWLSAASVYGAMGAACAVASVCWWLLDDQPMRFSRNRFVADWRRNWSFGKWAMLSQLTGLAFYALPWMLASVHGEAQTGEFAACSTLVGLSSLFVMGLNNFLMPKAAHAFTTAGPHGILSVLRKAALCSIVVLGTLCVVVYFAGNFLAGIVYGHEYADTGPLVTMLALATLADAMGLTASTGLWAMDRPAVNLIGDAMQLLVTLAVAIWLVFPLAALGIAIALVAGRTAGAAVRWGTLWVLTASKSSQSIPAQYPAADPS